MATINKTFLDLTGLESYDALIKAWSNSANQIAFKTVEKSTDGNKLLFFKKSNAIVGTDTPDKEISLGNTDMQTQLDALADIVGATYDSETETYSMSLDNTFGANVDTVVEALNELKSQINILNGADTVEGSVAKSIKDAVEALDTSADVGIASVTNNVVTLKGSVKEVDGVIAQGEAADVILEEVAYTGAASDVSFAPSVESAISATNVNAAILELEDDINTVIEDLDVAEFALGEKSTNDIITIHGIKEDAGKISGGTDATKDITFAKVAATGTAADVTVVDEGGKLEATNVEAALAELADAAGAQKVYLIDNGATSDYAKVYSLYQGNGSVAAPVPAEKLGDINIPKDKVVEDGSVVTITFNSADGKLYDGSTDVTELIVGTGGTATAADAGKYIKLVLQNVTDPLYIAAQSLVDIYTGGTNTETTVTIDGSNVITVTIGTIEGTKIGYQYSGTTVTESVTAALTRLDGDDQTTGSVSKKIKDAIDNLDTAADVNLATYAAGTGGAADVITLTGAMNETNGVIAGISDNNITLSTITTAEIDSLFTN